MTTQRRGTARGLVLEGGLVAAMVLLTLALRPTPAPAQQADRGDSGPVSAHAAGHGAHARSAQSTDSPLREPGNAAFAAIREVVRELNAGPDTDWSRIDLEALRRHLRDMQRFTLEAEVVERENIDGGLRVVVRGHDPEGSASIRRALHAHAPMLEEEESWSATATDRGGATVLEVTGEGAAEVGRIRGLGYIGLMATGAHHRQHHWEIATGGQPHAPGH